MGDKSTTDAPEGETSDSPAAAKDIVQRYRFRVRMADGRELVSRVATVTRPAPVTQARIDPHVACAQPSGMEGDALPVELSLELDTPAVLPLVMLLLGTEGDAQVFTDADCKKELGGLDVSMFKENKLPLWVHGSGDVALTLTVTSKPSSNAKPGMPATVQLTYHSFLGVRVVDSSGAVVTGLKVQIASDKESREQTLAQDRLTGDGSFRFDRIPAGKYKVSLPELDASLWGAAADPVPAARFVRRELAVPPGGHVIAPGDDIWTLGVRYAVQPSAIWDFPDNGAYKATYPNPYTLLPAQVLYIPPPQIKWVELDSGATHQLVIADPVRKMKVRLDVRGKPVPDGLAVTVRTDAGEQQLTTRQGAIELVVPPGATRAQLLTPGFGAETYEVRLGELPPIESAAGVVRRLVNIGYLGEPGADQTKNSEALAAAAQTFQRTFGLALAAPAADGTVDANTRAALVQAAGA